MPETNAQHPFDALVQATERSLDSLARMVYERGLAVRQAGQRELAETVADFLHAARRSFGTLVRDTTDREDRLRLCRLYETLIDEVRTRLLPFLGEPHGAITPPQISTIATGYIHQLTTYGNCLLIVHPTTDAFPEMTLYEDLAQYMSQLIPLWPSGEPPKLRHSGRSLVVLSYPELQARNPIYYALLLGHELMHLVVIGGEVAKKVSPRVLLGKEEFQQLITHFASQPLVPSAGLPVPTLGQSLTEAQLSAAITRRWHGIRDQWLEELACDLLATRMLGPVYPYAFAQLSIAADILDQRSDSHPHSRFRLAAMIRELRNMKYPVTPSSAHRPATRYLANLKTVVDEPGEGAHDMMFRIAEKSIATALDDLTKEVRSIPLTPYVWGSFRERVPPLLGLIREGVPPSEIIDIGSRSREPAGLPDILNAAFEGETNHLNDIFALTGASSIDEQLEACDKFQELVLLALHGTEIVRTWREADGRVQARKT